MTTEIQIYDGAYAISHIYSAPTLEDMAGVLADIASGSTSIYIVCDSNVTAIADKVNSLLNGQARESILIEATEENKNIETVMRICGRLLEAGADRNSVLIAVGGGITTDMAGFAASIYRRGIRFVNIPTTLLAQVDAAIGGKTGVNFDAYKNMLGVINQPLCTLISSEVLNTLTYRDFLSGASEMLKTFLIEDRGCFRPSVALLSALRASEDKEKFFKENSDSLSILITAAARVKARIVSEDQFEHGERRKLNLGHTFAHAIEKMARVKGLDVTHGEAVSMGMVLAAELSERIGFAQEGYAAELKKDIEAAGLAADCPFSVTELAPAMKKDKKSDGGSVHFVLVAGPDRVEIKELTVEYVAQIFNS